MRVAGCLLAVLFLALASGPPAEAHGDLHTQIAAVTASIARDPGNAGLYLKRGELHRFHRDWDSALADYERVAQLDPSLAVVDFARGQMLLEAGRPRAAEVVLNRFLAGHPEHAAARVARARVLVRLGRHGEAVAEFTRAIDQMPEPQPEFYLERARALEHAGDARVEDAIRGLDEGIRKLGPLVTLQLRAIDLELRRRDYDGALARLDRLTQQSERRETWLARRGEILDQAGRPAEARTAYAAALAAIEALPPHRRHVRATLDLERRLQARLQRASRTAREQ